MGGGRECHTCNETSERSPEGKTNFLQSCGTVPIETRNVMTMDEQPYSPQRPDNVLPPTCGYYSDVPTAHHPSFIRVWSNTITYQSSHSHHCSVLAWLLDHRMSCRSEIIRTQNYNMLATLYTHNDILTYFLYHK